MARDFIKFNRGQAYIRLTEKARLNWEKFAKESDGLSSYFLGKHLTGSDKHLEESLVSFVKGLCIATGYTGGVTTTGSHGREVFVDTSLLIGRDRSEPVGKVVDTIIGKAIMALCMRVHQASELSSREIPAIIRPSITEKTARYEMLITRLATILFYIAEVERVIEVHGEKYPGHAQLLIPIKRDYFVKAVEVVTDLKRRAKDHNLPKQYRYAVMVESLCYLIAYPSEMDEQFVKENEDTLELIGDMLSPYPLKREGLKKAIKEVMVLATTEWGFEVEETKADKPKSDTTEPKEEGEEHEGDEDEEDSYGNPEEDEEEDDADSNPSGEKQDATATTEEDDKEEGEEKEEPLAEEEEYEEAEEEKYEEEEEEEEPLTGLGCNTLTKLSSDDASSGKVDVQASEDIFLAVSEAIENKYAGVPTVEMSVDYLKSIRAVTNYNDQSYEEIKDSIGDGYMSISKLLYTLSRKDDLVEKGVTYGRLDTTKLVAGRLGSKNIYKNVAKVVDKKIAIALLIDLSGSMRQDNRYMEARKAAVMFVEALKRATQVKLFVYGFTADIAISTESSAETLGEDYQRALSSGGCNNIVAFYEPNGVSNVKDIAYLSPIGNNRDGSAIAWTVDRVRKYTDEHVIMFVISDGKPNGHEYDRDDAIAHTRRMVLKAEKRGVTPIRINVGESEPDYMFKNSINLKAKDFYKALEGMLHNIFVERLKVEWR